MINEPLTLELITPMFEEVLEAIGLFSNEVEKRFEKVEKRFEKFEKRFEEIDKKFNQIDERFNKIDKRFDQVDKKFDQIDKRFDGIDRRLESMDKRLVRVETNMLIKGDLAALMRKEDNKLMSTVEVLRKKKVFSDSDYNQIAALEPFSQKE